MRKIIMLFSTLMLIFGTLFVLSAAALASDADILQPASTITYDENLTVNGTGSFNSVQIGVEGVGGVTYFNGTIVNIGDNVPVTLGDDMRIDGEIWRGTSKGIGDGMPIKISDTMVPTLDDINDLGWPQQRWQNIYYSDKLIGNNIDINGIFSLQPAGSTPSSRITASYDTNTLLQASGSDVNTSGIRYENYSDKHETHIGKQAITNFGGSTTDLIFHGIQSYNNNNKATVYMGLVKNHPDYDSTVWAVDLDSSGGNNRLGILAGDIDIKANSIYIDSARSIRFEALEVTDNSGSKCEAKINGVWTEMKAGTMLRGKIGGITKLRYCEVSTWEDLY
jgi:hypothetical protein